MRGDLGSTTYISQPFINRLHIHLKSQDEIAMLSLRTPAVFSTVMSYVGLGKSAPAVNVKSVEVHDIESIPSKTGRRLKHLIKLNHVQHSILYNRLRFHNHSPHLLGSAYLLGGDANHLNAIYEDISKNDSLEPWTDSPGEIAEHDHRDFLSKRNYQRAWVDFFEDQLLPNNYSWQEVVSRYIFESGPADSPNHAPMFTCLTAGLGHPLIHLGYAYELNSREIAMEALGLAATCYDPQLSSLLHQTSPNPKPSTTDLFEVFTRVHDDPAFKVFDTPDNGNLETILDTPALLNAVLSHYSSWDVTNPTVQFEQSQKFAAALLIATSPSVGGHGYDFFLVHLLTTSHAVRILLPFIPPKHHVDLVREWFLITLLIYVAQLCPMVRAPSTPDAAETSEHPVEKFELKGKGWDFVYKQALEGKHATDAHFVKACRALKVSADTWGDKDEWFLKSAVRLASEFEGWGGFGGADAEEY